tara:strand:- start:747 stop:1379 length:633 start_codon:yes stop_codon:yes gene_type:complete
MFLAKRNKNYMPKINSLLCFLVFIFLLNNFQVNASENKSLISIGSDEAKVTVKVFSSLTCPHCANFHSKIFNKLKKEFIDTNNVRFEHHGFPLDLAAFNAEKVLRCVENKEKRLDLLSKLYEKQDSWASGSDINNINTKLIKIANDYNLNDDKSSNCLNSEKLEDEILEEKINGNKKYSIKSTPTVFINEKKYEGEHNYNDFKKAIKKFL